MTTASYLELYLAPLQAVLTDEAVTDLYINRPGELWVERSGQPAERVALADWDEDHSWRLARQIAHVSHQGVSRAHPLLAATLPNGVRVQIAAPPASLNGVCFAFRRHLAAAPALESFSSSDKDGDPPRNGPFASSGSSPHLRLRDAVRQRRNIVISGGTGSGKTTLLNALLMEIDRHERLVTIEDAAELRLPHPNAVRLIAVRGQRGESGVSAVELLEASLRLRPTRLLMGELRGAEAFTYLRAVNTGHPGSITTLHANGPDQALTQLALMTQQAAVGLPFKDAIQIARSVIDLVVQVECRDGRRTLDIVDLKTP